MTDRRDTPRCLACHGSRLHLVPAYSRLPRITADCRPFPAGGELAQCEDCGAVQKLPSAIWRAEIAQIYSRYQAYYQGDGNEQISFDRTTGRPRRRSDILADRLSERFALAQSGALLDVGCGSGVTLRAFSAKRPAWHLDGYELDDHNLDTLRAVPGFGRLHTGPIGQVRSRYELITMIHSLEHFIDPAAVLRDLSMRLAQGGLLFIEVCNVEENPFDILVADHMMHFSPATLGMLLEGAGLSPVAIATDWVGREISAAAKSSDDATPEQEVAEQFAPRGWARLGATLAWLERFTEAAREAARANRRFGVFGTSISGTWLASRLGERVEFFVDEAPSRIGKTHLGRPILAPSDVPDDAVAYLALTPATARALHARLIGHCATWLLPPAEPFAAPARGRGTPFVRSGAGEPTPANYRP